MLADKQLDKSINGCMQAIISAYFYYFGIRSKKFYQFFFSKEKKDETMDKMFPLWPFAKNPSFNGYGNKLGKWTKMCREHFEYMSTYMQILLDEYQYRKSREHPLSRFYEWLMNDAPHLKMPNANLKKITVEWKSLNPKYRSKDITAGYRKQYKAMLDNDGGVKVGDFTNRDIPAFLLEDEIKEDSKIGVFMQ